MRLLFAPSFESRPGLLNVSKALKQNMKLTKGQIRPMCHVSGVCKPQDENNLWKTGLRGRAGEPPQC